MAEHGRRLIEEWLPIAAIGEESIRERRSMTALPPTYYLHVWWARRPLVASRAAILASLLPADADREKFMHVLGIHGDPVESRQRIDEAKRSGERFEGEAYTYKRAFTYTPDPDERDWLVVSFGSESDLTLPTVLDPTAGGGSIPFEGIRLGCRAVANDLNPVAWFVLSATVQFPALFGEPLLQRFKQLAQRFIRMRDERLERFFPAEPLPASVATNWIWARTITCPYCGGLVPLSPNWRLSNDGTGVRLIPNTTTRRCSFEIVDSLDDQSPGTVKAGNGDCPFPDCRRVIDGDDIKEQAQAGKMGDQLYAVVYKQTQVVGQTKTGKNKTKAVRGFRAPRPEDDVSEQVSAALAEKMPEWEARNIVPDEPYPVGTNDERPLQYGMPLWRDMFAPRQRLGHCTSVESFHDLVDELRREGNGEVGDLDRAALTYVAIAIDKVLNYNSRMSVWMPTREVVANTFNRHDFAFCWSYAEMAPTVTGLGYDWTVEQTGKALEELIALIGSGGGMFGTRRDKDSITITNGSGDSLALDDASVDCVVMDPPYYDNVMYAELADFFYVWLKRTAGLLYPEQFSSYLTDKDREAVANPAKFKGQKGGAKNLAGRDYQRRMEAIFAECRRVLKPDGVMTVMFTHKASGAWDALASGLVEAGFVITASWPVNTEAEGSLHIKEKSAAKSTIFLVCRPQEQPADGEANYWEDVEPKVAAVVRERVQEFQDAGIGGVDLYLACFGPALQVFSENWPLKRGRPVQQPKDTKLAAGEEWDPYAVRPEDALDAARREVKQWRLSKLASMRRQHHLDPLTEWYVLAWDAFKALRFPGDEALKLARVVGLDFDKQVKNVVCEAKGSDVILWDSKARKAKGKLGPVGEDVMLDTLHHCALAGREQNTGAAKDILEKAGLLEDPTLLVALEALLNVLPPPGTAASGKKKDSGVGGAAGDCDALEKLRRLAFADEIPEPPYQKLLFVGAEGDDDEDADEE
jgi:adenine-specific DNA methylase